MTLNHLVSNMNKVVDKVRRAEMSHPTEALRRRLEGSATICSRLRKISKRIQKKSLPGFLLIMRSSILPMC